MKGGRGVKVLFIGPYKDRFGLGRAAIDWILALDAAGVDVVARPVRVGLPEATPPPRLLELEARDARGADVVIQDTIPDHYDYDGRFARNVGMYFLEADGIGSPSWVRAINSLGEAWVPCRHNAQASVHSGVTVPLAVIPCAADMTRFERDYRPLPFRDRLGDSFVFYSIGEMNRRKNFAALIQAFHLEFDPGEPVDLVLKTSGIGAAEFRKSVDAIKAAMNLYPAARHYRREVLLTDPLSDDEMCRLHRSCDCYVGPGYGEGWGIPAFDAMAMGRTPICTRFGAYLDYLSDETGWLVDGHMVPVTSMASVHPEVYTARQSWCSISIDGLRRAMRQAYEDRPLGREKASAGMERAYEYSYAAVGRRMKGLLESR